ncbi:hypothetical protein [Nonomuraea sp. NPDC049400]|uniref:hypothetical protein n=1 Tax=Nonomuraea sp. NPDC049400 TaxID=3364352 RepID=UPI0037B96F37
MLASAGRGMRALVNPTAISPEQVSDTVIEALADGRFLILTHPETAGLYQARAADTAGWIAGMYYLQRKTELF